MASLTILHLKMERQRSNEFYSEAKTFAVYATIVSHTVNQYVWGGGITTLLDYHKTAKCDCGHLPFRRIYEKKHKLFHMSGSISSFHQDTCSRLTERS